MNLTQNAIKDFNPLNDYYFKTLMGKPERKDLTLNFLNSLYSDENIYYTDIFFIDKDIEPSLIQGKLSRLDIRAVLNTGSQVDIEVQICREKYMSERSLYYWSRMYSEQLAKGKEYQTLKPAISINILDFDHLTNEKNWHNTCHITVDASKRILTNHLEMHFLEIPKLKISDVKKLKKLDAWGLYFSGKRNKEALEVIKMTNPTINEALSYENYFSIDDKSRREYERYEDAIREEKSKILAAKEEGITETIQKNAINLLKLGVDVDTIAQGIGLSVQDVEALKRTL